MSDADASTAAPVDVSGIADPAQKAGLQADRLRELVGRLAGSG